MSRPTSVGPHKDNLMRLLQQMRRLLNLVQGVLSQLDSELPFDHNIPSLPTVHYRPQDLAAVQVNTSLSQLSSGLHSFKLHLDWLLHWKNQSGLESQETKVISNHIQVINNLVQRMMPQLSPQNSTLTLPPLTTAWDLFQTSAVVYKRLQLFSDWYLRALQILIHQANNPKQ
ncbi:interleukin-11 isoform X2 [Hoplias malabaricus]